MSGSNWVYRLKKGVRAAGPTFERVDDEVDLAPDHQFLQFFGPQVLAGEIFQRNGGVEIAGGLLGEDLEIIVRVCSLQGLANQVRLGQSEFGFASANGEGLLGGGGGCHDRRGRQSHDLFLG